MGYPHRAHFGSTAFRRSASAASCSACRHGSMLSKTSIDFPFSITKFFIQAEYQLPDDHAAQGDEQEHEKAD